jgi:Ca2+:H+ antiporter
MKYLNLLLVFGVLAIVAELAGWSPLLIFISSGLAMIPLAGLMGKATEALAVHTGPRLGGLLNATLGNAAELIITVVAIREGIVNPAINEHMLELVRASLTGSIVGNILLVLGLSVLIGGLRHGTQKFNRSHAGTNATMLLLAVAALVIPSIFSHNIEMVNHDAVEYLSLGVAGVIQFPGQRAGTVELSVKFLRPTRGQSVDAWAVALKRAEGLAFVEGELYAEGRLCAVATGIVSTARGVSED